MSDTESIRKNLREASKALEEAEALLPMIVKLLKIAHDQSVAAVNTPFPKNEAGPVLRLEVYSALQQEPQLKEMLETVKAGMNMYRSTLDEVCLSILEHEEKSKEEFVPKEEGK